MKCKVIVMRTLQADYLNTRENVLIERKGTTEMKRKEKGEEGGAEE